MTAADPRCSALPVQPVEGRELGPNARLYVLPAPRLRTLHLLLAFHQVLGQGAAARGSLLPRVLRRGTGRWPDLASLAGHLEDLFGASLGAAASKMGDHQLVELTFSCVGPDSLRRVTAVAAGPVGPPPSVEPAVAGGDGAGSLAAQGAALLFEMVTRPAASEGGALPGRGLREDYFREEKDRLARDIRGLADDRLAYAHHRCIQEMCRGEPYAEHSLGRLEDLDPLTVSDLDAYRRELLASAPVSAYLVGPVDAALTREVGDILACLAASGGAARRNLPPSALHPRPSREREIIEEADVEQGRLVLGLSTGVLAADAAHPAQVLYNGLLGGFVHSRLFRRIRDEAGLAYYAWSRVVPTKGLILISCGIQEKDYGRAVDLVRRELRSLARGDFSAREFEATRNSVLAEAKARMDSASDLVYGHLESRTAGEDAGEIAPWRRLRAVTPADVAEFGSRPAVDVVYLLARRPPRGTV